MSTPAQPFGPVQRSAQSAVAVTRYGPLLRGLLAEGCDTLPVVTFDDSDAALSLAGSAEGKALVEGGAVSADQVGACRGFALWLDAPAADESEDATVARLREEVEAFHTRLDYRPRVVVVNGVGLFAAGDDYAASDATRQAYLTAIAVMAEQKKAGGIRFLSETQRRTAAAESARETLPLRGGRVSGRIAVVTGAAQGFGLEIAQSFASEGGHVVLTDINEAGAAAAAAAICDRHGKGRAIGLAVNVTDGESVAACLQRVVKTYGGFDVFVANAGVLRAGSVKTQTAKDFDFVTNVNYKGYFVCVQNACAVLALQHKARPDYMSDIIQINSKSGLTGSNKNGAYAGSKFGGIGLTQSFAMELIEDGIKVNSICPGNFFDGPLWSDPNNGLFVQYLRTGKVPGAKTIADVKRFYEAKVPMGRGCTTPDVMKAVFYLIEQKYETGQAVPVTGGQVMLN